MSSAGTLQRVLLVHNAYQQRGGEDAVVESELALLRQHGHEVQTYFRHNDEVRGQSPAGLALQAVWSRSTVQDLSSQIQRDRPDVIHVHNTLPLVSPAVFWVAHRHRIPVVMTLHNFRLLCPQAMLLREGRVCEDCVGRSPWPAVVHGCYRGSRAQTAVVSAMLGVHRALGTWQRRVSRYIALNEFARQKYIEGGLPAERIVLKPNFVDLPRPPELERSGVLFVGRLSEEKGVRTLIEAAQALPPGLRVTVVGDGPLRPLVEAHPRLRYLGPQAAEAVQAQMAAAQLLLVPSIWFENFPRTIVEAFACGLPVIASRLGALPELVEPGFTGDLVEPGNGQALAACIQRHLAHAGALAEMGRQARRHYELHWSASRNYETLIRIYESLDVA
ncbi:glycosyltransferase [Pelomonas sp. BJYL3]|uniref:glycosyltransferase n=1 Tax=Pelomonas sp. BJYL3 TaxID=2976697 RepID=UPI0022B3D7C4|nr:glycosyltransferase [Pelomonas sp. BJYL3]